MKSEYMQRAGEDILNWKYRLILGKASKDVKLSWGEIAEVLALGCSGEYLRKTAYGILEYVNWQTDQGLLEQDEDEIFRNIEQINQLEEKRMEMEREKIRMQDQKREVKALLREWARAEKIKEDIMTAVKEACKVNPIKFRKPKKSAGDKEGVVLFSDWHRGSRSNNHWNTFSDVEFEKRVQKMVEKTVQYGKNHDIKKLHVFLLGDLVNGLIHVTTRIENMEDVVKSTMIVAETISNILAKFSSEFEEIVVYGARGNHDRVTPNKNESVSKESFFDFIPWYLEARLQELKNVRIAENEYDDEIIVAEIAGHNIFAVHGHKDRMASVVSNLSLMTKIFPSYIFMGHYHHHEENEFFECEVVGNSSLSGTDEYAKDIRRVSKAAQKFMIFDQEEGRLCTYNVKLS